MIFNFGKFFPAKKVKKFPPSFLLCWIRDPDGKKQDPDSGINKHPGSATLAADLNSYIDIILLSVLGR
jgi:hypothetical protein